MYNFYENTLSFLVVSMVLPFLVGLLLLCWLLRSSLSHLALDQPNQRSLHSVPVPRTGGLAIMGGTLVSWIAGGQPWIMPFVFFSILLVALSFIDDIRGLSAGWRFMGHSVLGALFVVYMLPPIPVWLLALLTLSIVWMTNLYNFMDGSDGLAGGMAIFGFGSYAVASWLAGNYPLALACMAILASATAFLIFNFYPARIFMGDVGSIPLGFLAAAIGLLGWQSGIWQLWFPVLVFSPFIVDATVTLIKRLLRGEKIWQAHRSHYYQRLVQMGWGHRKTALWEYGVMLLVGSSAIWLIGESGAMQWIALAFWALLYSLLMLIVDIKWRKLAP